MGKPFDEFYSNWEGSLYDLLAYISPSILILSDLKKESLLEEYQVFNNAYDALYGVVEMKLKQWSHLVLQIGNETSMQSLTIMKEDTLVAVIFNLLHSMSKSTLEGVNVKLYAFNLEMHDYDWDQII